MDTQTNDKNPAGTKWWNEAIYGSKDVIFPEEDHQVAALPKLMLLKELEKRLFHDVKNVTWKGKVFNFSAVSNKQLLHHIAQHLEEV